MKKLFSLMMTLLLFTIAFSTVSEASTFREVKQVEGTTSLRVNASPSATIQTSLSSGSLVTQFSTMAGGWSYVQANNLKGYVATKSLATPKSTIKMASSKSGLVIKQTASSKSKTVATLPYSMIVQDFGKVGAGWSFVQYGNVTGYVNTSFISVTKPIKKYTSANVTLRNIASKSGESIGSLSTDSIVSVHSQIAGWSYITSGNKQGYVPSAQLSTTKPKSVDQTLKTFTGLLPTKIYRMEYYLGMVDKPKGVLSGYLESDHYAEENMYNYVISNNSNWYPPYMSYSADRFAMGMPETDWIWANIPTPLVQNKPTPIYRYDLGMNDELVEVHTGNAFLRTTKGTITTPAGTFLNVVDIEVKTFGTSVTTHYYFSPGYGLIKIMDSKNKLLFELREID